MFFFNSCISQTEKSFTLFVKALTLSMVVSLSVYADSDEGFLFDYNTQGYADAHWQSWCDHPDVHDAFNIYNWCLRFSPEIEFYDPLSQPIWQKTQFLVKKLVGWLSFRNDAPALHDEFITPARAQSAKLTRPKTTFAVEFDSRSPDSILHFNFYFL